MERLKNQGWYGIFGGTFDPPHLGHLILASEALWQLRLECVLWVVTADPPHKLDQKKTPVEIRLKMVEAAVRGEERFQVSRVDVDRPAPHYAVETVRLLKAAHREAKFIYLMGGDSLRDLPEWHDPHGFVEACDAIGVMRRPGDQIALEGLEGILPGLTEKVRFVDAPLLEISSSELRERASTGLPVRYYVPDSVHAIIEEKKLYLIDKP